MSWAKVVCGSGIGGLKLFNILILPAMIEEKFSACVMKLKAKFELATAGQRQSLTQLGHLSHVILPFALGSRRERLILRGQPSTRLLLTFVYFRRTSLLALV